MTFFTTAMQVVLAYGSLVLIIWAFVDVLRFTKSDFDTVERMPRTAWLVAFGFAFAMMLWLGGWRPDEPLGPRSFMWLASMMMVGVYIYDIRPRLVGARTSRER